MTKLVSHLGPDADAWDRITVAGITFKGDVSVKGTPWKKKNDHRSARGRNGGRTVATGWDLGEWTIDLLAYDDETVAQLEAIIEAVTGRAPATQDATALPIDHPALAVAGVNQVTFDEGDAPNVTDAGGFMAWSFKVKEYRPPAPRDVTRAPAAAPQQAQRRDGPSVYSTPAGPEPPPVMRAIPPPSLRPTPPAAPTADP